jgi:hypothetical protein
MVYLTLRGIVLAGVLRTLAKPELVRVVEVHPGAALCLHGAQLADVMWFSKDPGARSRLLAWLAEQGMKGMGVREGCTGHFLAACGAAFATWKWHLGKPVWISKADPPWHPYDFAC